LVLEEETLHDIYRQKGVMHAEKKRRKRVRYEWEIRKWKIMPSINCVRFNFQTCLLLLYIDALCFSSGKWKEEKL